MTQEQDRFSAKRLRELHMLVVRGTTHDVQDEIARALRQAASDAEARESPPSAMGEAAIREEARAGMAALTEALCESPIVEAAVLQEQLDQALDALRRIKAVAFAPEREALRLHDNINSIANEVLLNLPPLSGSAMGEAELIGRAIASLPKDLNAELYYDCGCWFVKLEEFRDNGEWHVVFRSDAGSDDLAAQVNEAVSALPPPPPSEPKT